MAKTIAVIDSETDPFMRGRVPRPFVWGFYDGETYEKFDSTIELIRFLYDKDIIVYAHNGGKFDWHFLIDYIEPLTPIKIINGRLSKFKIGECEFRDSYNILPTPLSAFAKDDIDYSIFERAERIKPHNKKKIERYLYTDCLYLYKYVNAFIDRFGMNLTLAGTAMKQWEKISGLKPPKDENGAIFDKFSPYYYGGRCQSFVHGIVKNDFTLVDINSAYPYAMLSAHPYDITYKNIPAEKFLSLSEKEKGACFLDINCKSGGALPFRDKCGSLFFPADDIARDYKITGWEYLAGVDTGTITDISINNVYRFSGKTDFSCYINHFYEERQIAKNNGDIAGNIFCKLLLNSLYGKFGSNFEKYRDHISADLEYFDSDGCLKYDDRDWEFAGEFGALALARSPILEEQENYYNVATAASITGFVRGFMWRALCQCDTPLYCDTDSIAAYSVGDLPNGMGKKLGQWDCEGEFSRGAFAGRKLYCMEKNTNYHNIKISERDAQYSMSSREIYKRCAQKGIDPAYKIACKGVDISPADIFKLAKGHQITYVSDNPVFSVHKKPYFSDKNIKMVKKRLRSA